MSLQSALRVVALILVPMLGGCAAAQRELQRDTQEVVGHLETVGAVAFVPCDSPADDTRWQVRFYGRAERQYEHLRTANLLTHSQPLLLRVTGYVSDQRPRGQLRGGSTRTIAVTDILGMQLAGSCGASESDLRPVS